MLAAFDKAFGVDDIGRFADQFFADGAHPSGLLVNERPLNRESAAAAKAMLVNTIRSPFGETVASASYPGVLVNCERMLPERSLT